MPKIRHEDNAQGRKLEDLLKEHLIPIQETSYFLLWALSSCQIFGKTSANFGPFRYLALLLTIVSYFDPVGEVRHLA